MATPVLGGTAPSATARRCAVQRAQLAHSAPACRRHFASLVFPGPPTHRPDQCRGRHVEAGCRGGDAPGEAAGKAAGGAEEHSGLLVSFSNDGASSRGLTSVGGKLPVSVNIATLSSFEAGELASDGGIAAGRFMLPAAEAEALAAAEGLTDDELLLALVGPAASLARPPVSAFHVGAVGRGGSGNIYIGVNLEFRRLPLANSVHAEQFLLVNMLAHGETTLSTVAISAAPCGHCRQFYSELGCAEQLRFVFGDCPPGEAYTLEELLPRRFRPADLLGDPDVPLLLQPQDNHVQLTPSSATEADLLGAESPTLGNAVAAALGAARDSYAPYSRCPAGLAVVTAAGAVYAGPYLESAAYNPSLPPLQAALATAVTQGMASYERVVEVVLAERDGVEVQHEAATRLALQYIAPNARLHVLHLQ
eukprot:jgi/Tetstr1/436509/TSEL_025335.t1